MSGLSAAPRDWRAKWPSRRSGSHTVPIWTRSKLANRQRAGVDDAKLSRMKSAIALTGVGAALIIASLCITPASAAKPSASYTPEHEVVTQSATEDTHWTSNNSDNMTVQAQCPAGKQVTGGGFKADAITDPQLGPAGTAQILESRPDLATGSWVVVAAANSGTSIATHLTVYAVCANS